jgi:glycosyltransferase involved in cell wall biosynthesis
VKPKIAFVVQRYGLEVNGGAELECRLLAELMVENWDITVLTTCALDYMTWENYYPSGVDQINGVRVRRFPVRKPRNIAKFNKLSEKVFNSTHSYNDEIEWMKAQGPDSSDLSHYIQSKIDRFDLFIFFTYLYGTTFWNLPRVDNKAILVPTAHDEPPIYLSIFNELYEKPIGFIFNTPEEKKFLIERFQIDCRNSDVVGVGVQTDRSKMNLCPLKIQLPKNFVIYAGRIDESKGCGELFSHWRRYKQNNHNDLKLILVGRSQMEIPRSDNIISLGFISEAEKFDAISNSKCLIMPSPYESLSIVLLEAWLCDKCVLVNGKCEVLTGQCRRSNGGLWYQNYEEFEACLNFILENEDTSARMAAAGRKYTRANYDWPVIKSKLQALVNNVIAAEA